ncbi:MAG: AAA family ATPase, partial [Candidatus Latescibacterota bacterium]
MLLRLRIQGFKNLRDVDIRFGPLTCFMGRNGVGKSNIFDAIQFLRLLSEREIQHAAEDVRSRASGAFGPLDLFSGLDPRSPIRFAADILVPQLVLDDFGEEATPATNLLSYSIEFRLVRDPLPRLELVEEELLPLKKGDARRVLGFPHDRAFREAAVKGSLRRGPFISTQRELGKPPQVML